ncbi:MAG: type II secretion system protein, partial [Patescibacteria group bacterium]
MISHKKVSFSILGFTLIELLITIAIVGIIAVVAFVALDPARRFAEARNATRWTDVVAVLDAIKLYQVDNTGQFPWVPASVVNGNRYMIGTCDATTCFA